MQNGLHSDFGERNRRIPDLGGKTSQKVTVSEKPIRKAKVEKAKSLVEDPGYPDKYIADALADMLMPILQ
jgi:hypothetical protein